MANNIIKRVWNQNRMVNIEDLCGMAFQAESGGHTFEISGIDDEGNTVALTGTVAGVFRRPDNADIALTGTASGGVASVTLTTDCYAVSGRFGLTIFVTSGGQKTAVYAAVGTVSVTSGGGVAGDTPQDVVDLINAINAAVATIPADYTDLMAAIAPTYSNSALYAVGSYAWYDGKLYRCTTAITTGESWTAAHWTAAVLGNDVGESKSQLNQIDKGLNDLSGVFHYDDFAVGALYKTNSVLTFDSSDKRMVSTPNSICFPVQITITPTDGYRMDIYWTDGRPRSTSGTGWVTSPVTVNANQWFMMILRKVESDTGYEADVIDFVNKFSVSPSPLRIAEDAALAQKTMYVSTGGNDTTGVGTLGNPYATISKAIAMGAEIIQARAGTYAETVAINGGKIKICAYWETFNSSTATNRPKVVIDGNSTIETALTIENCSEVILEDLVVQNCTGNGALINKCDTIALQNCEFNSNGVNGIVINYSNGVIRDCKANSNGNDGFNMNYFGDTQFYNCSGHDNGDDGISHHQGTTGCINGGEWYNNVKGGVASPVHGAQIDIFNIYSHDNGYGVYANADDGTVARVFRLWNSVLTNNNNYGLTCKRNTCIMYNCKITGNTAGQTTAPSGGSIITL